MTPQIKALLVLAAALAFAASPFFVTGFNGFDASQFPIPQDNPPVQPAGYAFSIWGVIYLWLIAGAAYGVMRRADDPAWAPARWPLLVSLAIGTFWLPVAQGSVLWATAMIWLMLISALIALSLTPAKDRWWLQAPVALYAGWLTAASCVSIGLVGAGYGLFFGQTLWALLALLIALGIAGSVLTQMGRAPEYGAAVIWALIGVFVANIASNWAVAALALIGVIAIAVMSLRNISANP